VRVALDTNVLVYAEGFNDARRAAIAQDTIEALERANIVVPLQVFGEFFRVLQRKSRLTPAEIASSVRRLRGLFETVATTPTIFDAAIDLCSRRPVQFWDAMIVAAAVEAGCGLLLSEDFGDDFEWAGLIVANPFADVLHPLLAKALTPR